MSGHINAKKGEIAERILLPGDPLRAKYIAEHYIPFVFQDRALRPLRCIP